MTIDIPFADAYRLDPSPTWAALRENEPVARVRTLAGAEVWLVTRYEDVRTVLADPRFSRAAVVKEDAPRVALARPLPRSLTTTDPPEHTRLRQLVSKVFAPRRIEQTRPWVREIAERLTDDVERTGDGADLRTLFALPMTIQVICELLGVPYEDRDLFREWTELGYSMNMADRERVDQAMVSMQSYIGGLEAVGLLGELREHLDHDELVSFGVNLLVAGHETSANQIASCVATLLRFDEWEGLHDFDKAVEELLRYNRFSEVGQLRIALEDVELHGVTIKAGDGVMAALNAANRDPRAFERPDELDVHRSGGNQHLSFGAGPHFCLGAQLARIELQESLKALHARFPTMKLAKPAEELEWRKVLVSGLAELPVILGRHPSHRGPLRRWYAGSRTRTGGGTTHEFGLAGLVRVGDSSTVSEETIQLDLNESGVAVDLPLPTNNRDQVQGVPYRPVEFRDDDLPTALERAATWLRQTQDWLGEPVDVIAVHLDYDDTKGNPYYDLKLLCNDEDLAGVPRVIRDNERAATGQ